MAEFQSRQNSRNLQDKIGGAYRVSDPCRVEEAFDINWYNMCCFIWPITFLLPIHSTCSNYLCRNTFYTLVFIPLEVMSTKNLFPIILPVNRWNLSSESCQIKCKATLNSNLEFVSQLSYLNIWMQVKL